MHRTRLRKVGGSVMMAVPPVLLEELHLGVGMTVGLATDGDRLLVLPQRRPVYTMAGLLAECAAGPLAATPPDREWLDVVPVGREL